MNQNAGGTQNTLHRMLDHSLKHNMGGYNWIADAI